MNWVDLVVLAIVGLSGLVAFLRGLVREVMGLGAWIAAAVVASPYGVFPWVQPWMRQQIADPTLADIAAFAAVFVVVLIVMWIVAGMVASFVQGSMLGGLDRTLGLLFGLARGAVVVALAYVLVGMAIPVEQWPPVVTEARALPMVQRGAVWIADQVPPAYRPAVAPLPSTRPTTSADLLQPNPTGRAVGARPARDQEIR